MEKHFLSSFLNRKMTTEYDQFCQMDLKLSQNMSDRVYKCKNK